MKKTNKVSKYFDDVFHYDPTYKDDKRCTYELNFNNKIQKWTWNGQLDRNRNKILNNVFDYATDTYLAIDTEQKIVGGYSYILESCENKIMNKEQI